MQKQLSDVFKKFGVLIILLAMMIIMTILSSNFLTYPNLINIVKQISIYAIIGFGAMMVIITSGIDLSAGAVIAVVSVSVGVFNINMGLPIYAAVILSLLIGALIGAINGFFVAVVKLPPFIATLGMQLSLKGLSLIIAEKPISGFSDAFKFIGRGEIFGVPTLVYFLIFIAIIMNYLLAHTKFGRYVYAIGGNQQAAMVSGISVSKNLIMVYVIAGVLNAVAGILMTARVTSAMPQLGEGYEMDAIAGAVIGGTSLAGGRGTILGTVAGALIIGVLNNGLDLMHVTPYMQQVMKGIIIILAVVLDKFRNKI